MDEIYCNEIGLYYNMIMRPFGHFAVMNAVCENWKMMIFNWEITQTKLPEGVIQVDRWRFFSHRETPMVLDTATLQYFENTYTHKWIWEYHSALSSAQVQIFS